MSKRLQIISGLGFFALMLTHCVLGFYQDIVRPGSDDGWNGSRFYGEYYVNEADPAGPAKELRKGDRLVAVNGVPLTDDPRLLSLSRQVPPGTFYTLTVLRDGQELTFTIKTFPRPPGPFPWADIVPILFWLTGIFVFLLKTDDQQARLLALMLGSFSGLIGNNLFLDSLPEWLALLISLARVFGLCSLPLLLHLFLIFPQPSPLLRRWPRLTRWLYLPLIFILPGFGTGRLPINLADPLLRRMRWMMEHGLNQMAMLSVLAYLIAALFCLWLSYRTADTTGRRRLRVIMWGSLLGFGSLFLVIVVEFTGTQRSLKGIWDWLQPGFTLPLVPLSFAYAILRHRVIPISLIIRRGVRYLLVSRGSILLSLLLVGLIVATILSLLFRYLRPSALTISLISAAEGIAAWHLTRWLHQRYLAPIIDRRFFRQSYDAQQIVTELSESLRTTTDTAQLLESVADKLQAALQTESVTIFLRDKQAGDYYSACGCLYSTKDGHIVRYDARTHLSHDAATIRHLIKTSEPLDLDGSEPAFDLAATNGLSQLTGEEQQVLCAMKAALLLPLKSRTAMPGIVVLGARLGDLPFSGEDKRMLQSIGASASLALENAQLVESMIAEARRRQEIEAENELRAKELEEARQMQLSMLPKQVPQLPHLEIAAYMKTATEVGGDYYDFHLSEDGRLTIAIGDATGHGLKAGTMVTATKGLFNHLAEQADLSLMLRQTSHALKRMNLRSLFMAMTVVRVQGERLWCSVAGMPPILIWRAASQTIEEVPLHGAPLGGLTRYVYHQVELHLAPRDVVLLMSDGLPERFNATGEMFGYERIRELFCTVAQSAPQTVIERLLQKGDEWAVDKAPDDDMTFVVLRRRDTESWPDIEVS